MCLHNGEPYVVINWGFLNARGLPIPDFRIGPRLQVHVAVIFTVIRIYVARMNLD